MKKYAIIVGIWNHKLQNKEYIVDDVDSSGNGTEIYRSCYLDECESFCEEHGYDYEVIGEN